ncbi:MAG: glycoside hydrolase family 2 TIM barrel-domain containing protein [Emticicia sp.]|nr:glycoside hydrolase family 2 TIM barrel-domain containing protein [Emticicia sp.]
MRIFIVLLVLIVEAASVKAQISLKGQWNYRLDSLNVGQNQNWQNQKFDDKITLPGTLDDAKIGKRASQDTTQMNKNVMLMLTRKHRYIGAAWYQKEIVITKELENATLFLERVIWKTDCWIDGKFIGTQSSLSTPQQFKTGKLSVGKHNIVLRIDNSKHHDISFDNFAHAYTDGTQIIWNGVIGEFKIIPQSNVQISDMQVFANAEKGSANLDLSIENGLFSSENTSLLIKIYKGNKLLSTHSEALSPQSQKVKVELSVKNHQTWDEFNPNLYKVSAEIISSKKQKLAEKKTSFGFRKLENNNGHIQVNGRRVFMRGTLDCNIYPIEGHPPMDKKGWNKVFMAAKNYGLNHIRFHSWCPPKAAFEVADSLGFYLQVELPLWALKVGEDKPTLRFLEEEAQQIIKNYGNHPSFCFWSMGNELEGDFNWLNNMVANLKKQDNRRFYAATTFTFQKGHGKEPEPNDDYFVTQYTKNGWVRGQGVFNAEIPNFRTDYSKSVEGLKIPLITHEIGQYSVFPDLTEIPKYTGVLEPLNYQAVRHDMRKKGLLSLADSFKLASGKFAVKLYKEEIERAIKTNNISGFQLLDIHDFSGQGTALVGILNAFWESKGLITPDEFREFCSPVVPLLQFEKATYTNNEKFIATAQVSNFSNKEMQVAAEWVIKNSTSKVISRGKLPTSLLKIANNTIGEFEVSLENILRAEELTITLQIPNTNYKNSWKIWVYPAKPDNNSTGVTFTNKFDEAMEALDKGMAVVFNPDTSTIKGVDGRFTSVFWSPVHFPNQPGTMGLLCNPKHPALANFPTDFYSNWQWWDLVMHSKTLILDEIPQKITPLVRMVDNFFKNRNMGTVIESKVGKGRLILCSMDLKSDLENRPAARQLKYSLMQYAQSNAFNPQIELSKEQLSKLLK